MTGQLPESEPTNVVRSLLDDMERDLLAFRRRGPNYRSAGSSAVTNLNAVIRVLREIRTVVAREISVDDAERAGNLDHLMAGGMPMEDAIRELLAERYPELGDSDGASDGPADGH
jgi:hypothetical protein